MHATQYCTMKTGGHIRLICELASKNVVKSKHTTKRSTFQVFFFHTISILFNIFFLYIFIQFNSHPLLWFTVSRVESCLNITQFTLETTGWKTGMGQKRRRNQPVVKKKSYPPVCVEGNNDQQVEYLIMIFLSFVWVENGNQIMVRRAGWLASYLATFREKLIEIYLFVVL